jgi:hypothetical protein
LHELHDRTALRWPSFWPEKTGMVTLWSPAQWAPGSPELGPISVRLVGLPSRLAGWIWLAWIRRNWACRQNHSAIARFDRAMDRTYWSHSRFDWPETKWARAELLQTASFPLTINTISLSLRRLGQSFVSYRWALSLSLSIVETPKLKDLQFYPLKYKS